jgi:hypothetical protein
MELWNKEAEMIYKKLMSSLACNLLMLVLMAASVVAQGSSGQQSGGAPQIEPPGIVIQGKIEFNQTLDNYVLVRETPFYIYMILNPDSNVLSKLEKEGKVVTVQGSQPKGADYLLVETIDGNKYP